jgi:hypothetical protein
MEIIQLPGYTQEEKLEIARRYLVGRQIDQNGLKKVRSSCLIAALRRSSAITRAKPACARSNGRSARSAGAPR